MKIKKVLLTSMLLVTSMVTIAQFTNTGIVYVDDDTAFFVNENFNFGTQTQTSRTVSNGVVSISALALNASTPSVTNYVDGFVKIYPSLTAAFYTIPLGHGSFYAPIGVLANNSETITAAYIDDHPATLTSTLDSYAANLSATEYWSVLSTNSGKITLYWNANSDLPSILEGKPTDYLTVLGYDGVKWITLDSEVNVASTSITTSQDIDFATYMNFTIGARKDILCYPFVSSSGQIKSWNGTSWSPSAPSIIDPVIINAPLSLSDNLDCYSVELNEDLTLTAGKRLMVVHGFSGTGKIIMSNLASVVQQNPLATPPKIEMTRILDQMRRYDYVFLSNPITNSTSFFDQILNNQNAATNGNFGSQPNSAFQQLRTFDLAGLSAINATAANTPIGRGFSATVRSQAPYSTSNAAGAWYSHKEDIHLKIEGTANNGRYTMVLPETNGYMRIGNPYPSPINGEKFWELAEGHVDKTLYYWTYHTARGSLAANSYNNADFATYNESGGTAAFAGGEIPDGTILPMQSALIRSVAPSDTISIDNCVRFFDEFAQKTNTNVGNNGKFRLNLQGSGNSFSQILIAYHAEKGTAAYDNGLDSYRIAGISSEISSLIANQKFTIQTRSAFAMDDVVPLHFDKRTDETFTISLATTEGVFQTTNVLLHDKTLEVYHNLSISSYSFTQISAEDTQRFDVLYENDLLDNEKISIKKAFAYINKSHFYAQANTVMVEIKMYDMTGRLVAFYKNIDHKTFSNDFNNASGFYVAKIKLLDGTIVNQKIINQ